MHNKEVSVDTILSGRLLVIAPHMDDEIIGCGGLMLLHEDKHRLHCIYASDGERSPNPLLPWQRHPDTAGLARIRERESRAALTEIGVPQENVVSLHLPDGGLLRARRELQALLELEVQRTAPDFILVPFRFDLHSDHVAVHRAIRNLERSGRIRGTVLEYFIYFRWRLLDEGDVRLKIPGSEIIAINITSVADRKLAALACYRSQTTIMYSWQQSPILTEKSIRQRCREPEYFMISSNEKPLLKCFSAGKYRLLLAHYIERFGKRKKDQIVATYKWVRYLFTNSVS